MRPVFTVTITAEFQHSRLTVPAREERVARVPAIVPIAILVAAPRCISLDIGEAQAAEVCASFAAILSLGIVYWRARERGRHLAAVSRNELLHLES